MLKNLKKKFAKVALVVLALQLVFLGLGANPTAVKAAENVSTKSISISSEIQSSFVAGTSGKASLTVDNQGGLDYKDVEAEITIAGANSGDLAAVESINPDLTTTDVLSAFSHSTKGLTAEYDLGSLTGTYVKTFNFDLTFKTPGTYGLNVVLTDESDTVLATLPIVDDQGPAFNVLENISISTTMPSVVKLATDVPFTATVDNTYGANHNVNAKLTIKDALVTDIAKLKNGLSNIVLTQEGANVVAEFNNQSIKAGTVYPFSLTINFVTEKKYDYTLDLNESNPSAALLATLSGSVTADGTAPVVTMTSKPVIVNDVAKEIVVTFTGNESISLSSSFVVFTQGSKTYSGVAVTPQVDPTKVVVIVPADQFDPGVSPITVAATFKDLVGNVAAPFTARIEVDTIAPAAVTGVTTLVNADGTVTLSWVNPPAGTFSTLRIVRVGDFTVTLDPSATSYTDATTVKGQTYQYVIVVGDEAGNETTTAPVSVTVPAPVVASAISDTTTPAPTNTNTTPAVNASTTDTSKTDNKPGFPAWGIILLVILALVGGYLIWNQKPATPPVVETKKPNTNSSKKK